MQASIRRENMGFHTHTHQEELMSEAIASTLQLREEHSLYDNVNAPMVLLGDSPEERYSSSPDPRCPSETATKEDDPALHPSSLHYRTNFKEGGYVPPKVGLQPSRPPEIRQEQDSIYRRRGKFPQNGEDASDVIDPDDPDMPFDVLNEILRSNSSQTCSTSNANHLDDHLEWQQSSRQQDACHRSSPPNELDPEIGRFTMGAPKFSDPSPCLIDEADNIQIIHQVGRASGAHGNQKTPAVDAHIEIPSPERKSGSDYEEFGVSPPSSVTDTVVDDAEAALLLSQLPRKSHDDDSLFEDLDDDKVAAALAAAKCKPQGQKKSRKIRVPSPLYRNADCDDTSLEELPNIRGNSPKTLQERAAQAWAVRREKNAAALLAKKEKEEKAKVQVITEEEEHPHDEVMKKSVKVGVSFGKADTVHHYQPEEDEENTCYTDEERSLNSEYTKTLESEVEDVIKDILMIGDGKSSKPGRRKFKHKHSVKRRLRDKQKNEREDSSTPRDDGDSSLKDDDAVAVSRYRVQVKAGSKPLNEDDDEEEDDDTLETDERQEPVPKSEGSAKKETGNEDSSDDPFQLVFGLFAGGVNAMTSAFGLFAAEDEKREDSSKGRAPKSRSKRESTSNGTVSKSTGKNQSKFSDTCGDDIGPFLKNGPPGASSKSKPLSESEKSKSMKEFVNYAQDLLYSQLVENPTGESGVSLK